MSERPVMKINLEDCYLVARYGYGLGETHPDQVYWCGSSPEEKAKAKAAAEEEMKNFQEKFKELHFEVHTLSDQIYNIYDDGVYEGERKSDW